MTDPLLDEYINTLTQMRTAIREAHEVLKDMRAERKAVETLLRDGAAETVDGRIEAVLVPKLEEMTRTVKKAMADSVNQVTKEFKRIEEILLGTDPKSRRQDKPSVEQMIVRFKHLTAIAQEKGEENEL